MHFLTTLDSTVDIVTCRHHVCVEIPIKKAKFERLPERVQSGAEIKVIPIFFNIGINEQATIAEK